MRSRERNFRRKPRDMSDTYSRGWVSLLAGDKEGQVEKVRQNFTSGSLVKQVLAIHTMYATFRDGGGDLAVIVSEEDFKKLKSELTKGRITQQLPLFAFLDIDGNRVYKSSDIEPGGADVYIRFVGVHPIPSYIRTKSVSRQDLILINTVIDFLEKAIDKKGVKDGLEHCRERWRLDKKMLDRG